MKEKQPETKEMNVTSLMKDYANYNLWANAQLIDWLKTKPSEIIEKKIPSSFPSIKWTLKHVSDGEKFWLEVLKQESTPDIGVFSDRSNKTVEEVFKMIVDNSKELALYVNSLTESSITKDCHVETPWFNETRPRFEYILHVMNHSTYHRGQIITIGRNVGLTDAPMTDFNIYNFFGKSAT
ncbi:DinB family protein [Peribacillus butanolivorans]|uniref:DinB family protein n=1 Tax=Peribacillus butanolivorans TaxID=421767 RepID=UPI00364EA1D4